MHKLDKDEYLSISHLMDKVNHNIMMINAIAEGYQQGTIFVDNKLKPESVLIAACGTYYVFGNEDNKKFN